MGKGVGYCFRALLFPQSMPEATISLGEISALAGVGIDHADFEWLRAVLQRESSRSACESKSPRFHDSYRDDESDTSSTIDAGSFTLDHAGRKRAKPSLSSKAPQGDFFTQPFAELPFVSQDADEHGLDDDASSDQKRRRKVGWTSTEDLAILATVRRLGTQWQRIAAQLPGRTADAVRNRWHRLQKTHSLGDTEEGRAALDALLLHCGISQDWEPPPDPSLPQGTNESNSCIKGSDHGRAMWTREEDALIEEGVRRFGCKWRQIASSLPGRSDSSVRNRWMRLQKDRASAREEEAKSRERLSAPVVQLEPLVEDDSPRSVAVAVEATPLSDRSASPMVVVTRAATPATHTSATVSSQSAAEAGRPSPFLNLKRSVSSSSVTRRDVAAAANEPLGFRSPMLGFDLEAFVEAVMLSSVD